MRRSVRGFTVVELVITLLIGSILTSIALASFGNARGRFAVRGARTTFATVHARARAHAIELGGIVRVWVDVSGDSVVLLDPDGVTLENIHFADEFNVDLRATSSFRLCMNARGYADESCGTVSTVVTLEFWQNADSATVKILPLGQLVY